MKPVILCILDGWGVDKHKKYNSIAKAKLPNYNYLIQNYPHTTLWAGEEKLGLPKGQMGNSEVGHMSMGSGRIIPQPVKFIGEYLAKKNFLQDNAKWNDFIKNALRVHILGIASNGGVHGHIDHMIKLAQNIKDKPVLLHLILDGRDTLPQEFLIKEMPKIKQLCENQDNVKIATVVGRVYAMDRNKNFDRTEIAYNLIVNAEGSEFDSLPQLAKKINQYYEKGNSDEFIPAMTSSLYNGMKDGDGLLITSFRADRIRQITGALSFDKNDNSIPFSRNKSFKNILAMNEYSPELKPYLKVLFEKKPLKNTLAGIVSDHNLKQFHIAETEKYAHVSFFFNGGKEQPFPLEDRCLIKSKGLKNYAESPSMSTREICKELLKAIKKQEYSFILVNFAAPDMVGHSGNLKATITAVQIVDEALGQIFKQAKQSDYALLITADHGNAETMYDDILKSPISSHTLNKVPFIIANYNKSITLKKNKSITSIGATVLKIMDLPMNDDMDCPLF